MSTKETDVAAIEAEVENIRSLGVADLRQRWCVTFGSPPPNTLTKDLIARILTYRIQEQAFGGLNPSLAKLLDRLAKGNSSEAFKRRLKPGTLLVREYDGEQHQVTVAPDGFVWNGSTYCSLSTIALEITGTKWNGPRFFGLRDPRRIKNEPKLNSKGRGRPRFSRSSVRSSAPSLT